ncbi:MAG: molecular chaperone Tir, partial [Chthoniobacteraceae bacterium]|nr:molecular chaperone Tir [Chthoniobacteraceae bacterium]
ETLEFLWSLHEESLTRRLGNLFDELRTRTLLLIGNGQPDWLARFFVRLARRGRLSSGDEAPHEFFADEEVAADIHLRDFLQNFSYQTSIFSARHPIEFVDQLAQRWEDYPDKPLPIRGAPAIPASAPPAIFLSYARQDGAAVERLAHQLDAAGLDTWYDRARLSSGDPWWPVIDRNIATCVIFVPVISVHTNARDEGVFLREWNRAIERFNDMNKLTARFIHPVIIDESLADNVTFGSFRAFQFTRAPDGKAAPEFIDYLIKLVRERRARRLVQL